MGVEFFNFVVERTKVLHAFMRKSAFNAHALSKTTSFHRILYNFWMRLLATQS